MERDDVGDIAAQPFNLLPLVDALSPPAASDDSCEEPFRWNSVAPPHQLSSNNIEQRSEKFPQVASWRQPFDSTCLCRQNSALNTRQPTLARGHDERIESGRKHVFAMRGERCFLSPVN